MSEIVYRRALEGDYQSINDFYNRIYQRDRSIEEFRWEFHDSPAGPSVYVIALDGNKVVGTNCVIPIDMVHSDGRKILSGKSEDTLVDPTYRGKRIFANIYEKLIQECRKAGVEVIWGFTPVEKAFKKIGFDIPFANSQSLAVIYVGGAFDYLVKLNPKNKVKDKLKIFGLVVMSRLKMALGTGAKESSLDLVRIESPMGIADWIKSELDMLNGSMAIDQTGEYQNWRYSSNPHLHDPHYLRITQDQQCIGQAILNITKDKVAYISEVKFSKEVGDSIRIKVLRGLVTYAKSKGAVLLRNWNFSNNAVSLSKLNNEEKAGFVILDRGSHFVWMNLSDRDLDPCGLILTRAATQGLS